MSCFDHGTPGLWGLFDFLKPSQGIQLACVWSNAEDVHMFGCFWGLSKSVAGVIVLESATLV